MLYVIVAGMVDDLEKITLAYSQAVQRIRRMALPAPVELLILADVLVLYRAERDRLRECRKPKRVARCLFPPC